jgi:hypothetical protein
MLVMVFLLLGLFGFPCVTGDTALLVPARSLAGISDLILHIDLAHYLFFMLLKLSVHVGCRSCSLACLCWFGLTYSYNIFPVLVGPCLFAMLGSMITLVFACCPCLFSFCIGFFNCGLDNTLNHWAMAIQELNFVGF